MIVGHLKDHCTINEGALLHWLFPGKELVNGLRVLIDDKSCIEMADSIVEGGVAEIYVVDPDIIELPDDDLQHDGQNSSRKVNGITESREKIERQILFCKGVV